MIGYIYNVHYGILYKAFEHEISSMTRTYVYEWFIGIN